MPRKILIFSEEYRKITNGLCTVWTNHAFEASKNNQVEILLNHEHWAFDEVKTAFTTNAHIEINRLPIDLPSTILKQFFKGTENIWPIRAVRYVTGEVINTVMAPFIIIYMAIRLHKNHTDAIFSHNGGWPAGDLCRWIIFSAKLAKVPKRILIIHSHPTEITNYVLRIIFLPFQYMQARMIDYCSTNIVTVSDSVKSALELNVFKRPVKRIYNGIQITPPIVSLSSLDWFPSKIAVGFVGALYSHKGAHVLLDAFKLIDNSCELALLGPADPIYLKILKKKAEICKNKVSFLGYQKDVDSFMQRIDFLVVPSIAFESFGMVILEAMKHRKAVICSDFGGMKEIVVNGVTGLVVPAGDDLKLAKAINDLLSDSNMRQKMGDAGFQRLMEFFTSEKMAAQYDQLL